MKKTLLQQAKEIKVLKRRVRVSDEHIELAIAWMKDEIGLGQINIVMGQKISGGNVLYNISVWLREAYRKGIIKVK